MLLLLYKLHRVLVVLLIFAKSHLIYCNAIFSLIVTGYRRQLTFDDLWELRPSDRCDTVMPKFEAEWSKELIKHNTR